MPGNWFRRQDAKLKASEEKNKYLEGEVIRLKASVRERNREIDARQKKKRELEDELESEKRQLKITEDELIEEYQKRLALERELAQVTSQDENLMKTSTGREQHSEIPGLQAGKAFLTSRIRAL